MAKLADLDIDAMMAAEGLEAPGGDQIDRLMAAEGLETAPPDVPSFLQPHPIPGIPGMGGDKIRPQRDPVRPADIPAPPPPENPTLAQMILPSTMNPKGVQYAPRYAPDSSGRVEEYVPTSSGSVLDPLGDVAGLPARLLGSASDPVLPGNARGDNADGSRKSFGQGMANPETGVMRPVREKLGGVIADQLAKATDEEKPYIQRVGNALLAELAGLGYVGAAAAEDPTILVPGAATPKAVAAAEKLGPKIRAAGNAVAEAPNKLAGRLAEEMSGVSEEALRTAGSKEGRAAMEGAFGKQKEIGDRLLDHIENMDDAIPEREKVADALAQMGDISLEDAINALEDAKAKPSAGRLFPNEETANAKIDTYIQALRGGPVPEDLGAAARGARSDRFRTEAKAQDLKAQSKQAGKETSEAAAAQRQARSDMGKAANQIKAHKKHETDYGWWYDEAKTTAKTAAQAARKASQDLEATGAVAGVRSADAEKAAAAVTRAERDHAVADAAASIYSGRSPKETAQDLIKNHGLRGADLKQVLAKAEERAAKQPDAPDLNVPASDFRNLRKKLDVNIDFNTEEGKIVNDALKHGRGTMKDNLIQKAKDSGNPDYEKWMRSWANKLDKLDAIKKMLGGNPETRASRVERFIGTLFGKNTEHKQQLVRDLDEIFGSKILGEAKSASLASELGKGGKAAILPRQFTGRSVLGLTLAPGVSVPFASPYIASRVTLPFFNGLEKVLKFTGGSLTNKSQSALRAAMKTRSAVVQMRLLKLIEKEIPLNAVPFKQVAQADQTKTEDRRYARR